MPVHEPPSGPKLKPGDALVVFGITGDLASKMTIRALYRLERAGRLDVPVVGVARNDWTAEHLRKHFREALKEGGVKIDAKVFKRLSARLSYVQGDYGDAATFEAVAKEVKRLRSKQPVFYLEIPPSLFATVVHGLHDVGLSDGARFVIEKPFGHDLSSARALNAELHEVVSEDQILRIDHYLGKEPVMDILYLRFANSLLEPIWNSKYVSYVQLTMAENIGVEDRGSFYDPVGTLRDVVQNHALQILGLLAMEPPAGHGDDPIRDAKLQLFKAIEDADPRRSVRGQYAGYRKVDGVAPRSTTETYVALELAIHNWRWFGVPFFLRAGKKLPTKVTELRLVFKRAPDVGLDGASDAEPNQLVVRIDPQAGAQLRFLAKAAATEDVEPVDFEVMFEKVPGSEPEPYERLLGDALEGHPGLFMREDMVEETWRIVEPLIDKPGKVQAYEPGTWGPKEADKITRGKCEWHEPWLPESG